MTLAWTLVVPRVLGPAGMGLLVAALAATGVLGVVLGLGTRNYLVREMVVDWTDARSLIGTAIAMRLLLTPLFAGAVVVYVHLTHASHDGSLALYLVGAASIFTLLAEPMQAGFQALERMQYLAYSDVINKSAQGLLGIVLVLVGFRVVGIAAGSMAVAALVVTLNALWLRRHVEIAVKTTVHQLASMVKHSIAYGAFGVFFMVYLWIDSVMLSLMTRPEVVGWYGVPTKLFQSLMFLPVVVSTAWLPRLVSAFQHGPERLRATARTPLELVLVLSLPICATTAILARPAIQLLYGSPYANASPVMVVLGLCIPPMYLNIMLNQVLIAAKRQRSWTWVMAGATVINPLFNLALIPLTESRYHNGAIGASVSLLLTELVIVSVGFVMVGRDVVDRALVRRVLLAIAASSAMWGVAFALRSLGTVPSALLGGAAFVLLAIGLGIVKPEELALLGRGLTVARGRLAGRCVDGWRRLAAVTRRS
jgi:O-antigen/teichoic acid export membrane protein